MNAARTILTVDDSEIDRELIEFEVNSAFPEALVRGIGNPGAVEQLCADQRFDCVLLDYNMPEMDGLTLARRLRAAHAYLPIVLMTNVGDEMLVAEALLDGVSDYVVKSRLTAEAVRRIVDRAIHTATQARLIDQQHEELENFAYALAHDFKQPIRQIITFSEMISDELNAVQSAGVHKHLGFLSHAATRLDNLVDVMVQYTLLSQPPELTKVRLSSVMAAIETSLEPLLRERRAELVTVDRKASFRGNETLMIQVLQNLIVNGLRYNTSAVPRVEVDAQREPRSWLLSVRDNGIGIEPEYLTEIFKPLVRLHSHKEYPGSGLGLTLARKAVHAQNGEIWCESALSRGSVFRIRIPISEPAVARKGKGRLAKSKPKVA
jgi:signal transduction histidine kinase